MNKYFRKGWSYCYDMKQLPKGYRKFLGFPKKNIQFSRTIFLFLSHVIVTMIDGRLRTNGLKWNAIVFVVSLKTPREGLYEWDR